MVINKEVITALHSNYLTADEYIFIYNEYYKCGWDWAISPGSILKLKKTGFIEENGLVSVIGESLLLSLASSSPVEVEDKEAIDEQFEEFWKEFPKNDAFRQFPKTRDLRLNKVETKRQYRIARQDYSHEQLIGALKAEIADKSGSTIKNLFTYMKGSVNWLRDKAFLDFFNYENTEEENNFFGKDIKM